MFKHNTKAALNSYIAGTKPISGIHMVLVDESWYNEKIEYLYKDSTLSRLSNPKIEFIRLVDVANFAAIATTYTSPVNKNMVVVLADETAGNKTTWYTYNVSAWVLMGEFLGTKMERSTSKGDTRGAVIHELTDFTIPFKYTVGRNELAIYVGGVRLSDTDFLEIGTTGVLSNKVQFTSAIMNGTEIEFVREVHSNETTDPAYQIVQQKIIDDAILKSRIARLKSLGFSYGGTIQDCKLRDFSKVYYCNVNDKFYIPKINSVIPNLTAASNLVNSTTYVASASSEHAAPFPAWYAFNTDYSKFWHNTDDGSPISASNTEWLKIDMGIKTPITHMLLDPRVGYQMNPDTYILEGSDDGAAWTQLLSVSAKDWSGIRSVFRYKALDVVVANNRYYRLTVKKTEGGILGTIAIERMILVNNISKTWVVADSDWFEISIDKKLNKPYVKTNKTWDVVYCNETPDDLDVISVFEQTAGVGYLKPVVSQYDILSNGLGNVSGSSTLGSGAISFTIRPFDCYCFVRGGSGNTAIEIHER